MVNGKFSKQKGKGNYGCPSTWAKVVRGTWVVYDC